MTSHIHRWILTDPATNETWEMPINPDSMTSPHQARELATTPAHAHGEFVVQALMAKPSPKDWEWSGVIRSQEHYDAYLTWVQKPAEVHVTDHLGRTFEVFMRNFEPDERRPTFNTPWRFRYTVKTVLIRRVS